MRGSGSARPTVLLSTAAALATAAIVTGAGGVSATDDAVTGVVLQAGWGDGDISPLGLIIGVILAILALKLLFRLIAGARWYGGPWGYRHAGWYARMPQDAPEAFRRWHDQAHEQGGHDEEPSGGERPADTARVEPPQAVPADRPAPPRDQPSQPEAGQPTYGQPTHGQYPGQPPYWSGQGQQQYGQGQPPYGQGQGQPPYAQPPYGQYPGQPPYGQLPGPPPPWAYPAQPYPAPGQVPQAPYAPQPTQGPYPGDSPADQRR
jgi:hypothetical protein